MKPKRIKTRNVPLMTFSMSAMVNRFWLSASPDGGVILVEELVDAGLDGSGSPVCEIRVVLVGSDHVDQRTGVRADDPVRAHP